MQLVKTDDGRFLLQGDGVPTANADFALYDLDGEGGDPFGVAPNQRWSIVDGVPGQEYDPEDSDTFWGAVEDVVTAARDAGIPVDD